jgi:uncharacterized membrane protein (Fun14 family)
VDRQSRVFFIGLLIKKIFHIILIVVGSFLGVLFLAIKLLQAHGYLSQLNWDRIGTDTLTWFQGLYAQFSSSHIFAVLGIPASSGLTVGCLLGIMKG